jgi:tRNA threonylcarbamoyl adenosine modification protein YjeE
LKTARVREADVAQEVILADEAATLALGARLAPHLTAGDVVALTGELGAGKTTLARGLIAELARRAGRAPEDVPSPTFSLVQSYEFGQMTLWHFDLYRLKSANELAELGWEEALATGASLVEWPERAGPSLPRARLDIAIEWVGARRRAKLSGQLQNMRAEDLV